MSNPNTKPAAVIPNSPRPVEERAAPFMTSAYSHEVRDHAWDINKDHALIRLVSACAAVVAQADAIVEAVEAAHNDAPCGAYDVRRCGREALEAAENEAIRVLMLRGDTGAHVLAKARERGGLPMPAQFGA